MSKNTLSRIIKCPMCGKTCEYSESNKYRPFCSARCSTIDTGAWATEEYRIPQKQYTFDEQINSEISLDGQEPQFQ